MQVNGNSSVVAANSDPTSVAKRWNGQPSSTGAANGKAAANPAATGTSGNSALAQIAAQYDVTNITPTQFSAMMLRLQNSGALSPSELSSLAGVRGDLSRAGVGGNQSVNLLQFYQRRLQQLEASRETITGSDPSSLTRRNAITKQVSAAQKANDWLQKLSTLHNSPDAGVDMAA